MLLLVLSLILGLLPLLGIVAIALAGWLPTVDGLFTTLILLAISGVFFLNALLEVRARGWLPFLRRKNQAAAVVSAPRAAASAPSRVTAPAVLPPTPSSNGVVTEMGVVESVRLYEMPVGYADKSLVAFRPQGSAQPRSMVFCGNVQHLRPGRRIQISYKPSPDGNVLLAWE